MRAFLRIGDRRIPVLLTSTALTVGEFGVNDFRLDFTSSPSFNIGAFLELLNDAAFPEIEIEPPGRRTATELLLARALLDIAEAHMLPDTFEKEPMCRLARMVVEESS
jgi:hypothetical protein